MYALYRSPVSFLVPQSEFGGLMSRLVMRTVGKGVDIACISPWEEIEYYTHSLENETL